MGSQVRTGCHTECGRRPVNQDAVLAVRMADGRELVAVADGMGGHSAGEVASKRALEALRARLKEGADLRVAVAAANAAVHAEAAANPAWNGMGTTLVAMLRAGSSYEIANVGDSRAYRITTDTVTQITTDHSFVAEAAREARLATHDIAGSRWRNALTRALGTDAAVEVDCFGPFDADERHAVLLCSDGLYRSVNDDVLRQHVGSTTDPWAAARALAAEAYRNGSSDNISAAVILMGRADATSAVSAMREAGPAMSQTAGSETPGAAMVPAAPQPRVQRRRRRSRRGRRVDIQLGVAVALLVLVLAVLMRVW